MDHLHLHARGRDAAGRCHRRASHRPAGRPDRLRRCLRHPALARTGQRPRRAPGSGAAGAGDSRRRAHDGTARDQPAPGGRDRRTPPRRGSRAPDAGRTGAVQQAGHPGPDRRRGGARDQPAGRRHPRLCRQRRRLPGPRRREDRQGQSGPHRRPDRAHRPDHRRVARLRPQVQRPRRAGGCTRSRRRRLAVGRPARAPAAGAGDPRRGRRGRPGDGRTLPA